MVPGHREHRRPERAKQLSCALELLPAAAVREIAARNHELRFQPLHPPSQRLLRDLVLMYTHVQVVNMEEPGIHDRTRL